MSRTTNHGPLRRVAAAARSAVGGSPTDATDDVAALLDERDRLKEQNEALRRQAEVLRTQRDRDRYAGHALAALARSLDVDFRPAEGAGPLRRAVGELRAEALIAEGVLHGGRLDESVVRAVRALLADPASVPRAHALCAALADDDCTRPAAAVGLGLYLAAAGGQAQAHAAFSRAPVDLLVRTAAVEAVTCAFAVDPPAGRGLAEQIVHSPDLSARNAFGVAGVLVGIHDLPLARRALDRARDADGDERVPTAELDRLQHWLDTRPADLDTVAPPRQRPVVGIMQYDHPHLLRESINLGDYTQTVALLGHLLRRTGLRIHAADEDLQQALDVLRADIADDLTLDTPEAHVDVVPVARDASRWAALPEPTWTIAYGWYMRQVFGVRNDLPFHAGIRPIFLSFHVDRPKILTPAAVAYLRRYGPVGCRDWTTVDLLLSHGVDAFFSGCVTTTTHLTGGRRGSAPADGNRDAVGLVDDAAGSELTQILPDLRGRSLASNLRTAHERHRRFRDSFESLRTSRLHVYLPATSMGVPVEFVPRNEADVRFEGLSGLTPHSPELREIQRRITGLLDAVLDPIVTGAEPDAVYGAWRKATRPLVAEARARREHWQRTDLPVESLAGTAAAVRETAVHHGDGGQVHVSLVADGAVADPVPVVLQGIDENTSRAVRVHLLTRGVPPGTVEGWVRSFPRLRFSHYRLDDARYPSLDRTSEATLDRLLLPDVLADVDRVVHLDVDVAVLGDVGDLWDLDLDGAPLAARPTSGTSLVSSVHRAARVLPAGDARALRAWLHARVDGRAQLVDAGVLVLDLARMRADGFGARFAGLAARYGIGDRDVLCCYAGARIAPLDRRWNCSPTLEPVPDDVRLVSFAGAVPPWGPLPVPAKDRWLATRDRWLARPGDGAARETEFSGNYVIDPDPSRQDAPAGGGQARLRA